MARDFGTSLLSAAEGAMRGYEFVQGQRERKQAMGLREAADMRDQERHQAYMKGADQDLKLRDTQEARAADSHRINRAGALLQNQERVVNILAREAAALEGLGQQNYSEEELEYFNVFPQMKADYLTSEQMGAALQTAEQVIGGQKSMSSPEAIEAINLLFPEIQTGADDGRKRRVVMAAPGKEPNTLVFGLEVEGEKTPKPLTARRSSSDDDPVKQVPIEKMVEKIASTKNMRDLLMSPKGRQYLMKVGGIKAPEKYGAVATDPGTGLIGQYEKNSGKFSALGSASGASVRGGRGAGTPADYQLAKLIQQESAKEGKDMSFDQAFQMAKTAVSDPARYVSEYVKNAMEAQQYSNEGATKNRQQLEQEAIQSYQRIRQLSTQGKPGDGAEQPQDVDALIDSFLQ